MTSRRVQLVLVVLLGIARPAAAQGLITPGAGPINRAMAGASTAAPVSMFVEPGPTDAVQANACSRLSVRA